MQNHDCGPCQGRKGPQQVKKKAEKEGETVSKSEVFNEDCMVGMSRYPDKYFDLAVVDPPYGGGGVRLLWKRKIWRAL